MLVPRRYRSRRPRSRGRTPGGGVHTEGGTTSTWRLVRHRSPTTTTTAIQTSGTFFFINLLGSGGHAGTLRLATYLGMQATVGDVPKCAPRYCIATYWLASKCEAPAPAPLITYPTYMGRELWTASDSHLRPCMHGGMQRDRLGGEKGGSPPPPGGGHNGDQRRHIPSGYIYTLLRIYRAVLISLHALILLDLISGAPCLFILADGMAWADDGQMSVGARGQVSAFGALGRICGNRSTWKASERILYSMELKGSWEI